jgi:CHAT domain-containing protein/uncharacterized protein HemY
MKRCSTLTTFAALAALCCQAQSPVAYKTAQQALVESADLVQNQKYPEAIKVSEQGMTLAGKAEKPDDMRSRLLYNIGMSYVNLNEPQKALTALEESVKLATDSKMIMYTSYSLGYVCEQLKLEEQAVAWFKKAYKLCMDDPKTDEKFLYELRAKIADLAEKSRDFETSATFYLALLNNHKHESKDRIYILFKLGFVYYAAGDFESAIPYFEKDISLQESVVGRKNELFLEDLHVLGAAYFEAGYYGKAEKCYQEVYKTGLEVLKPNHPLMARVTNNLGNVAFHNDEYKTAIEYYRASLQMKAAIYSKDDPQYVRPLMNLAAVYTLAHMYDEALERQKSIYEIQKKTLPANDIQLVSNLLNMARSLNGLGRKEEAATICNDILKADTKNYLALTFQGDLFVEQRKFEAAEKSFVEALMVSKDTKPTQYEALVWRLASLYNKTGDSPKAHTYYSQGIDLFLRNLTKDFIYKTEYEKLRFLELGSYYQKDFVQYALNESLRGRPDLLADLYDYQINMKGRALNSLGEMREWIQENGSKNQKEDYEHWVNIKNALGSIAVSAQHGETAMVAGGNQIQRLANRMEKKLVTAVADQLPPSRRNSYKEIASKLNANEAAIEIFRVEGIQDTIPIYIGLMLTSGSKDPTLFTLGSAVELEKKFYRHYQNSVKAQLADTISYSNYWGKIGQELKRRGITKVFLSSTGVYNQVNLNTLLNPSTRMYLITELDLKYVTSTYDLVTRVQSTTVDKKALLVGHPTYSVQTQKPGEMQHRSGFANLPGSEEEVDAVATLLKKKKWSVSLYKDSLAKEKVIKNGSGYSLMHIATHGFFGGDNSTKQLKKKFSEQAEFEYQADFGNDLVINQNDMMLNSGLVLAGALDFLSSKAAPSIDGKKDDGFLTAFEVANLDLRKVQLVVLSACNTGVGDAVSNEGIFGLQRAFRIAGAKNLIMSYWPVSDEVTMQLMIDFYKEWSATGNLESSFRKAQLDIMQQYKDPYYWGAFVLVSAGSK